MNYPEGSGQSGAQRSLENAGTSHSSSAASAFYPSWEESRARVAVGPGVHVSGRLIFSEPVVIEGRFRGEIRSTDLVVIGEQAFLEGQVRAARLLVLGEMHGAAVGSRQVALGPRARFQGKVEARSLIVSAGAMLNAELKIAGGLATAGADRPKDQTKP